MTEAEWLAATDPTPLQAFLKGKASDRKLRLFAVACCQMARHMLVPEARDALDVAERFAEGTAGPVERQRVRERAFHAGWVSDPSTRHRRGPSKAAVCEALARRAWDAAQGTVWRTGHLGTRRVEPLRDIFGNPFRPVTFLPEWRTSTILALAEAMYDSRDFSAMPIVADALGDTGCADEAILTHCRGPGPYVRGCWVTGALLNKA